MNATYMCMVASSSDNACRTWGDCIVRVLMEKTTGGAQPMYGRVIFKSKAFVSLVLNGVKRASLFIGGREIWLREYIPRNSSNN